MIAPRRLSPPDDIVPAIVYGALACFIVGSSMSVQMSAGVRIGYVIAAAVAVLIPLALALLGRPAPAGAGRVALIAVACSAAYLIPAAVLPQGRTVEHVVVDFVTTIVPVGFLLIGTSTPATFRRILEPRWALLFVVVTLGAPFLVFNETPARSFQPPNVGVVALLATLAIWQPDKQTGASAAFGSFVLVALAGLSGSRSIVALAILAYLVVMYVNRVARVLALVVVVAALIVTAATPNVTADLRALLATRASSRVLTFLGPGSAGADVSTGRLREAGLVLEDMQTRSPLWIPLGVGHGAVFKPEQWDQGRTISEEGFVHNIHIGPLLMLFRYGFAGLILYLFIAVHAARATFSLLRRRVAGSDPTALLYAFGTGLFAIEFLVRNVLPNPMFSFFLAGHLAMTLAGKPTDQR